MKEYSKHIVTYFTVGMLVVLLGANSGFAQTNQSSQQQGNQTGNQSAAGGGAIPPRDVIQGLRNETTAGFSNTTDVENLTTSGLPSLSAPTTTAEGMEKSQLGDVIPGEQGTQYEGEKNP
ncbi:MAG TPA: hypothetical protein VE130_10310 [Nitrososphaeraceae archaeon]|nr:hypothetical protein [Nitrososphaeraceae archaeon]